MIFVAKNADFSANNIGKVNMVYDDTEGNEGYTVLITSIQIKPVEQSIVVGDKVQLKTIVFPLNAYMRTDLKWSVSDTKKAIISDTGFLTVLDEGNVTITAEAKDGSEVSTNITLTFNGRSLSDVMEETYAVLKFYQDIESRTYTNNQIIALDTFLSRIGIQYQDSIWNKIRYMIIPCLGGSTNNAFVNMKNGYDVMTKTPENKSTYTLQDGWLRRKTGATAKNISLYTDSTNKSKLYANQGFFYAMGGYNVAYNGGASVWREYNNIIFGSTRLGFSTRTGELFYADTTEPCVFRLASSGNTEESSFIYPSDKVKEYHYDGVDEYLARLNSKQWSMSDGTFLMENNTACLCVYAYGEALSEDELNALGDSLVKFFTDFGVDVTTFPS